MKKNSTARKPKSESSYAKRQRRLAERILKATAVYSPEFRQAVRDALNQYKSGDSSNLLRLFREADELDRVRAEFRKDFDSRWRAAIQADNAILANASTVDALVSNPQTDKTLKYALQAVLIEFGNESDTHVDAPGVAGTFYTVAARKTKDSMGQSAERCLRHLDLLLNNPDRKTMKAIIKYWDDGRTDVADPFPATDEGESPRKKPEEDSAGKARPRKARPKPIQETDPNLVSLREKLAKLERVPENEAIQFQMESEIYKLEREAGADEWPDVIGGPDGSL